MTKEASLVILAVGTDSAGQSLVHACWHCPLCNARLDRTVAGEHGSANGLNLNGWVKVSESDGIATYGLRRGARLRGRDRMRRPPSEGRIRAAMEHADSAYRRFIDDPVFDAYCVNCGARSRIDTVRIGNRGGGDGDAAWDCPRCSDPGHRTTL